MKTQQTPIERLRHHVTGAIERGEATPIVEQRDTPAQAHSPLPWKLSVDTIFSENGLEVFGLRKFGTGEPHEANAAFIVRACNEYEKLKAKCQYLQSEREALAGDVVKVVAQRDEAMAHAKRLADALKLALTFCENDAMNRPKINPMASITEALEQWEGDKQ